MTTKKLLLVFMAMLLPLVTWAQWRDYDDDVMIDGIYYVLSGTTAKVSFMDEHEDVGYDDDGNVKYDYWYDSDYKGDIIIPASIDYNGKTYTVDEIINHAFYNCKDLTSVTIPSTVVSIGEEAFIGCSGLKKVYISDLERWCKIPFTDKTSNPLYYAHSLFLNDTEITELNIPQSVTSIGKYTFYNCFRITSVSIPNSVTSIGEHAFSHCSGLSSVTIPSSVTSIGTSAFYKCSNLADVTIPASVNSIGNSSFLGCTNLTSVTIPNTVTSIAAKAFSGCTNLISATIGNGVTSIEVEAFKGCSSLNSIDIPNSVTYLGERVFMDCTNMNSVSISNGLTSVSNSSFYNCSSLTSVIIPDNVTSIGKEAFSGCTSLSDITIPDKVNYVGENAFYSTKWYNNQPDGLVYVGLVLYKYKGELPEGSSITIKDGTQRILPEAFSGCIRLTSISIPNTVTSIPDKAFYRCTGLTTIIIPNSLKSIGTLSFCGCSSLTSLVIPDKVKSIGQEAFRGCSSLTSIVIPDKVKEIAWKAFQDCTGLKSVVISDGVTSIGGYAFSGCNSLTSVNIPSSVSSVCDGAFYNCKNLSLLKISSSVAIENSVFSGCKLKSLCIDAEVITDCSKSLYEQFGITVIYIGNNSKTIEDNAFSGLANIKSIILGNSVEQIKSRAFSGIENLESIVCKSTKVPDTHRTAFENSYIDYVTLHVPAGSVDKYKAVGPWKDFKEIVAIEGTEPISGETCVMPTISFLDGKLEFESETDGSECHYEIKVEDAKEGVGSEVPLSSVYEISVYASKEGYNDSEKNTATLYWINVDPIPTGVIENEMRVNTNAILVQNTGGTIAISGVADGDNVLIYTISGQLIAQGKAFGNHVEIGTNLSSGDICIIKIADKSVKYLLK